MVKYISLLLFPVILFATTRTVGSGKTYATITLAAAAAGVGDTIIIDAGTYGENTSWDDNNLVIMANGGWVVVDGDTTATHDWKGGWTFMGNNCKIDSIKFLNWADPEGNGAAIWIETGGLTVTNCWFEGNENGFLGGSAGNLIVRYSFFQKNGTGDGLTHNIYVSAFDTLWFEYNESDSCAIGHLVKTRAKVNYIRYNKLIGGYGSTWGTSSSCIDVSNGGLTYIIGNLMQQGPNTDNAYRVIGYGLEGWSAGYDSTVYIINNTIVERYEGYADSVFQFEEGTIDTIRNNIIVMGDKDDVSHPGLGNVNHGSMEGNLIEYDGVDSCDFKGFSTFNYDIDITSLAVNYGTNQISGLTPQYINWDGVSWRSRLNFNEIDAGAYEWRTAMCDSAFYTSVGEWTVLPTTDFNDAMLIDNSPYHVLGYYDKLLWDDTLRQVHLIGSGHNSDVEHIIFNDSSNTWVKKTKPGWGPSPSHGYECSTIDPASRKLWYRADNTNYFKWYNLDSGGWTSTSTYGGSIGVASAIEYFPYRNSILFNIGEYGYTEYDVAGNSWDGEPLATPTQGAYHNLALYNPIYHFIGFGGGNSSVNFYKWDSSGTRSTLENFPSAAAVNTSAWSVDPIGGNYILINNSGNWWEYDPSTDNWSSLSGTPPTHAYGDDGIFGVASAPIKTYGVIMFVKYNGDNSRVWLYKHTASDLEPTLPSGDGEETPATVRGLLIGSGQGKVSGGGNGKIY